MDNVDTQRMKRVLDRLYPAGPPPLPGQLPPPPPPPRPEPPPPPKPEASCALLGKEEELQRTLGSLMRRSPRTRPALLGVLRRSEARQRRLRTECFFRNGVRRPVGDGKGKSGVLSLLRTAYAVLETLETEYLRAGADSPRHRQLYERFARECASDTRTVRRLTEQLFR